MALLFSIVKLEVMIMPDCFSAGIAEPALRGTQLPTGVMNHVHEYLDGAT